MLELAVLALLSESPMHGYELRKRLAAVLGAFHRFSYGSLYPCLRRLADAGYVTADDVSATTRLGGRSRVVYTLTGEGKEKLAELLGEGGPSSWEDEMFGVRFAFFAKTDAAVRLRILEGRRGRLEERREKVRSALTRTVERFDTYTLELQRHGLESVEREVRWLNELIETERASAPTGFTEPQLSTASTGLSTAPSTGSEPSTGPEPGTLPPPARGGGTGRRPGRPARAGRPARRDGRGTYLDGTHGGNDGDARTRNRHAPAEAGPDPDGEVPAGR
ncbi:transcriptional regulator, PadR family [Frankia torreyi]|uniref:Transcriptional regulator, PadR family n=1 Tax=Frankia torreyi TaxID=1856 RepID=A0A0D8BEG1_9ACTN|nr:PadR family transcriptional regulator [Frankia torreyi]KJE22668.1 transcriptional regulator, PadR family [Frankia torreyi]